jgi:hypothetical protein
MRKVLAVLGAVAISIAGSAYAQTDPAIGSGTAGASPPGGIPVGPMTVYPGVDLAQGHNDNLFLRQTNLKSSSFTIVSPYVRAEAKTGPHKFDIGFRMDEARYHQSPSDNYSNYAFTATGDMVFSGRAGLKLNAVHRHAIDPRGSNDRTVSPSPDQYDNTGIEGVFRYGAAGARGRIEVDGGAYALRYTNNRAFTAVADRDTTQFGGTFYWRVMPRTEVLAQMGHRIVAYKLATSAQDSTEDRFLVGVKWEATAATTGTAKFGRQMKKFDSPGRADFTASSWDVGVRWSPLTYSVFDFVSSKQASESTGVGDAVLGTNYGVTWSHAWNSRLRTSVLASFRHDDFPGTSGGGRQDDTSSFGLKVGYDFRRWLRLGAEFTHTERESNGVDLNYKRNLLLFTVGATL